MQLRDVEVMGTEVRLHLATIMRFATHTICNDLKQNPQIQW